MSIASKANTINAEINNIKQAIVNKGQNPTTLSTFASAIGNISGGTTPTGTLSITANGTYDVTNYASADVSVSGGGGGNSTLVNCFIDQYGVPQPITPIGTPGRNISGVALKPFATTMENTPPNYSYVNYSDGADDTSDINIIKQIGVNTMKQLILPNLTYIYSQFSCENYTNLEKADLSNVESGKLDRMFKGCTALTEINLSKLSDLTTSRAMGGTASQGGTFTNCTLLTTLSFPALTSTSFGSFTNQFDMMLKGVTGCTVHFPSNLQSVIGSWSSVTGGFGGTNTTVLFDLPATT